MSFQWVLMAPEILRKTSDLSRASAVRTYITCAVSGWWTKGDSCIWFKIYPHFWRWVGKTRLTVSQMSGGSHLRIWRSFSFFTTRKDSPLTTHSLAHRHFSKNTQENGGGKLGTWAEWDEIKHSSHIQFVWSDHWCIVVGVYVRKYYLKVWFENQKY